MRPKSNFSILAFAIISNISLIIRSSVIFFLKVFKIGSNKTFTAFIISFFYNLFWIYNNRSLVSFTTIVYQTIAKHNPRHETFGSFGWFNCYNADLRAALVCFCTTFDLIFEARPCLVNFCLLILILPFGGIYMVIRLVPPHRNVCWDKGRIKSSIYIVYIFMEIQKD